MPEKQESVDMSVAGLVKLANNTYGPYAFGLVCVLLVWFFIVQPSLRDSRVDARALQSVADTVRSTVELQNKALDRMERISSRLDDVADKLGRR